MEVDDMRNTIVFLGHLISSIRILTTEFCSLLVREILDVRALGKLCEDLDWLPSLFRLGDNLSIIMYSSIHEKKARMVCSNNICSRGQIGKGSCSAAEMTKTWY